MANFDDFKQKAINVAETIADVSVEVYKKAEERAKVIAKTTKLSTEIAREKLLVKKTYAVIGKTYYSLYKDAPGADFAQSCADITGALDRITEKKKEIEVLKNSCNLREDELGAEDSFGDSVSEDDEDDEDVEVEIIIGEDETAQPDEPQQ